MRVLYIANGGGLSTNIGGSLVRTVEICKRLIGKKWAIQFATTSGGAAACRSMGLDADFLVSRASLFKKSETSIWDRALGYVVVTLFSFFQLAKLSRSDIIYTDSDYFCDTIPAAFYACRTGAKWIAMTHHMTSASLGFSKHRVLRYSSLTVQRFSYWLFRRYSIAVFVYDSDEGKRIAHFLISKGYDGGRIKFVMNGANTREIGSVEPGSGMPTYEACFVGGLRPGKGLYDIVPIWKNLLRVLPDARLAVIGGGARVYEEELRNQIRAESIQQNVILFGNRQWKELIGIVKRSKLFISPSHEEGWGIAICEALACGTPVVAYDLPVYRIFGGCIERVREGDTSAFASMVAGLLQDSRRREQLAAEGRLLSTRFDWESIAQREAQLFTEICASSGSVPTRVD